MGGGRREDELILSVVRILLAGGIAGFGVTVAKSCVIAARESSEPWQFAFPTVDVGPAFSSWWCGVHTTITGVARVYNLMAQEDYETCWQPWSNICPGELAC